MDESLWIAEWQGWDLKAEINAHVHGERRFIYHWVRDLAGESAATAIAELVGNSMHHGYGDREGTVWVRMRREEPAICFEVEDRGIGGLTQSTIASSRDGLAVVRGLASHVSTRNVYPTGTIVTAVFLPGESR